MCKKWWVMKISERKLKGFSCIFHFSFHTNTNISQWRGHSVDLPLSTSIVQGKCIIMKYRNKNWCDSWLFPAQTYILRDVHVSLSRAHHTPEMRNNQISNWKTITLMILDYIFTFTHTNTLLIDKYKYFLVLLCHSPVSLTHQKWEAM